MNNKWAAWAIAGATAALASLVLAGSAFGFMEMAGQMTEYPNIAAATPHQKQVLARIQHEVWAHMSAYDTLPVAEGLGYSFESAEAPAMQHMRKNGTRYWGKILNPKAPQALLWWCSMPMQCTLVGVMYRTPPSRRPPNTDGGLLQWHRHGPTGTWMTHVWLTHDLRSGFARCVPFEQLAQTRAVTEAPYKPDVPEDSPCKAVGSTEPSPASEGQMPEMAM